MIVFCNTRFLIKKAQKNLGHYEKIKIQPTNQAIKTIKLTKHPLKAPIIPVKSKKTDEK